MNVYSIDVRLIATAYIKAESEAEAKQIAAAQLTGSQLCLPDRVGQPDGCVEIFGLPYDHPDMPTVSLSPAMTVEAPFAAEPELVEEVAAAAPTRHEEAMRLLGETFEAWDGEEDSVKEEHAELIAELAAFLGVTWTPPQSDEEDEFFEGLRLPSKYRVTMTELVFYELTVEAGSEDEVADAAEAQFVQGDYRVTNQTNRQVEDWEPVEELKP